MIFQQQVLLVTLASKKKSFHVETSLSVSHLPLKLKQANKNKDVAALAFLPSTVQALENTQWGSF